MVIAVLHPPENEEEEDNQAGNQKIQ
jgi:hypothetical protein